jgi:hypothetical protein
LTAEDTRWLGCTGKLLAVEMLWFFASIYGAVTKPAGFTPNPVKANKHLITVVDTLIKALHLNKAVSSNVGSSSLAGIDGGCLQQ